MTLFEPDAARTDSLFPYDLGTLPLTPVADLLLPRELAPGVIAYPVTDADADDPTETADRPSTDNSPEATADRREIFASLGWSTTKPGDRQ